MKNKFVTEYTTFKNNLTLFIQGIRNDLYHEVFKLNANRRVIIYLSRGYWGGVATSCKSIFHRWYFDHKRAMKKASYAKPYNNTRRHFFLNILYTIHPLHTRIARM